VSGIVSGKVWVMSGVVEIEVSGKVEVVVFGNVEMMVGGVWWGR